MKTEPVLLEKSNQIAAITLNQPETLIAQTEDAAEGLTDCFMKRTPEFKGK